MIPQVGLGGVSRWGWAAAPWRRLADMGWDCPAGVAPAALVVSAENTVAIGWPASAPRTAIAMAGTAQPQAGAGHRRQRQGWERESTNLFSTFY